MNVVNFLWKMIVILNLILKKAFSTSSAKYLKLYLDG